MHDSRYFWAAIATIVMWVAITIIAVAFMIASGPDALGAAIFVFLMASIGVGGMAVLWEAMKDITKAEVKAHRKEQGSTAARAGKAKRDRLSRLERLAERLDDDDLIELETLLMAQAAPSPYED